MMDVSWMRVASYLCVQFCRVFLHLFNLSKALVERHQLISSFQFTSGQIIQYCKICTTHRNCFLSYLKNQFFVSTTTYFINYMANFTAIIVLRVLYFTISSIENPEQYFTNNFFLDSIIGYHIPEMSKLFNEPRLTPLKQCIYIVLCTFH